MNDFFGYSRNINAQGQIMSSEIATLTLNNNSQSLVQGVRAVYSQTVDVRYEVGSADIYYVTGQPIGQIDIQYLVGVAGFFASLGSGNACGVLSSVGIGLDGTGGCTAIVSNNPGGLLFAGAVPVSVGVDFTAGNLDVRDSVSLRVARMSQS